MTRLGTLCRRGHDHDGTGQSLRRVRPDGRVADCVVCAGEGYRRKIVIFPNDPELQDRRFTLPFSWKVPESVRVAMVSEPGPLPDVVAAAWDVDECSEAVP